MEKILREAVETLKNNYNFRFSTELPKKERTSYKEFMIGIYNRFDEIGLLYSCLKDISFNKAVEELEIKDYMNQLKEILKWKV